MANGNGNGQSPIPGAGILSVLMGAPTDILSLATRQIQDTMNSLNIGAQKFAAAAAVPPALPAGFPALPAGFPMLPGMQAAQPPAQPAAQPPAGYTPAGARAQTSTATTRPGFII